MESNGISVLVKRYPVQMQKAAQFAWATSAILPKLSPPPTKDSKSLVSGLKQSWIKPSEAELLAKRQGQINIILWVVLC